MDLLRAVGELRALLISISEYHGPEMRTRLEEVRSHAGPAQVHMVKLALLAPDTLAEPAERLRVAVIRFADCTAQNTDMSFPVLLRIGIRRVPTALGRHSWR